MDKWIRKFVHTVVDFDTIFFGGGGGIDCIKWDRIALFIIQF